MKKDNIHIFDSPADLAEQFAGIMMKWIAEHSAKDFHLAISGGKTPDLLFTILAAEYTDSRLWQKTHFWWVDERMVAPDDNESNFGNAHQLLFSRINIPEENIHRIKGENSPEDEALSYSEQIQEKLPMQNGWPVFDLIILGMGRDGHTASIFPDQMHLINSNRICEVALHPQAGQKRITMTGNVFFQASKVCFLVSGSDKAARLREILTETEGSRNLPASKICPLNGDLNWFVDKQASKFF